MRAAVASSPALDTDEALRYARSVIDMEVTRRHNEIVSSVVAGIKRFCPRTVTDLAEIPTQTKIDAIKWVRNNYNTTLVSAKQFVDAVLLGRQNLPDLEKNSR